MLLSKELKERGFLLQTTKKKQTVYSAYVRNI